MSDEAQRSDRMNLPIKILEQKIDQSAPWSDDKLGRKNCAEVLTGLLAKQTEALTVSLNGEWGSGKTIMLRRWRQQLENDGYKAVYFNAWEDDFVPDPLVAILGQLEAHLPEEPAVKEFLAGAGQVITTVASGIIKKATGVDIENTAEKASKAATTRNMRLLDDYTAVLESRQQLRDSLQRMANELFGNSLKPLVFIIDELDRCRPSFAIELLERIKHLFNIEHIVFVLGIDRKQLGQSIRSVYGDIDVENYLHRFIDVDFRLPQIQGGRYLGVLWEKYDLASYLLTLGKENGIGDANHKEGGYFRNTFAVLLKWHPLTLRELEHCVKLYAMVLKSTPARNTIFPFLLPILIVLKLKKPELYCQFVSRKCPIIDIINYLLPPPTKNVDSDAMRLEVVIYAVFVSGHSKNKHVSEVQDMLTAIREKQSIVHMSCASERIKKMADPDEVFRRFYSPFEDTREYGGLGGLRYDENALLMVTQKLDLIMTGVEREDWL